MLQLPLQGRWGVNICCIFIICVACVAFTSLTLSIKLFIQLSDLIFKKLFISSIFSCFFSFFFFCFLLLPVGLIFRSFVRYIGISSTPSSSFTVCLLCFWSLFILSMFVPKAKFHSIDEFVHNFIKSVFRLKGKHTKREK